MKKVMTLLGLPLLLLGCATQPEEMTANHVSVMKYQNYTCSALAAEMVAVSERRDELFEVLKIEADNDTAQTVIGTIFFWPALFLLEGGDGLEAAEYKRLKGEAIAIEQAQILKECGNSGAPDQPLESKDADETA